MSTHNYVVTYHRYKSTEPAPESLHLSVPLDKMATNSIDNFIAMKAHRKFSRVHTCRQYLCGTTRLLIRNYSWDKKEGFDGILGIRGAGFQYHAVAKIMDKYENSPEILSEFLSKMLKIKVRVEYAFADLEHLDKLHGGTNYEHINSLGKVVSIVRNGYITTYLIMSEQSETISGITISTLWGILREPKIIDGILSRKIRGISTLIRAFLRISEERIDKQDDSYMCYSLVGTAGKDDDELAMDIKNDLANLSNDDGSSWGDIWYLTAYLFYNYNSKGSRPETVCSGPVEFVKYDRDKILKPFAKKYPHPSLQKKIIRFYNNCTYDHKIKITEAYG